MFKNQKAGGLPRRKFVMISGVAGVAALLTGTSAAASPAAATPPRPEPPGAGPCPTPSTVCGFPSQTGGRFRLWDEVQVCEGTRPPPPFTDCLATTATYAVLRGGSRSDHDFLLVPSCRISGIECPFISTTSAPNYWLAAWENARPGGAVPVRYPSIGLGINSMGTQYRDQDQLHIHMAGILSGVQGQLNNVDSVITPSLNQWPNQIVQVVGRTLGMPVPRSYRAVRVPNLNRNLFTLLREYVVPQQDMYKQILVVTPRNIGSGGFYVLNSAPDLQTPPGQPGGTGSVDPLLVYN